MKPDGSLAWSRLTDVGQFASAALAGDGTIYIGGNTGLYALSPDGTTKWMFPIGAPVEAMPAIAADGTVVVGATDDALYAIRPDGTLRWKADASVGGPLVPTVPTGGASALIDGAGAVYVAGGPGVFRAFSPDGQLIWEFRSTTCPTCRFGSPAIGADGTVYAPADRLYAFAP